MNIDGTSLDLASLKGKGRGPGFLGHLVKPLHACGSQAQCNERGVRGPGTGHHWSSFHRGRRENGRGSGKSKISYPVAIDVDDVTATAYQVDGRPDYHIIDRAGNLRVADLANGDLERTVKILLAEGGGPQVHPALIKASEVAVKKNKRILVAWGGDKALATMAPVLKEDRAFAKYFSNEYERIDLSREEHAELAGTMGVSSPGTLSALGSRGEIMGNLTTEGLTRAGFEAFLKKHQIPQTNAETKLENALAQAKSENKRVLIHLGAPW